MMRSAAMLAFLLALCGCAVPDPFRDGGDPYAGLSSAPVPGASKVTAVRAFDARWPQQFRCAQTVTIDFRITSRTLVGYLVVQQPGKFRLQGMTEHGIKLFDIAGDMQSYRAAVTADEFDEKIVANLVRDVRRMFLHRIEQPESGTDGRSLRQKLDDARLLSDETGLTLTVPDGDELQARLVGERAFVSSYEMLRRGRPLYRVDQYEWQDMQTGPSEQRKMLPTVIVLRESGVESQGPGYKLTVRITDFRVPEAPWPDEMFTVE